MLPQFLRRMSQESTRGNSLRCVPLSSLPPERLQETTNLYFFGQVAKITLERIGNPCLSLDDPAFPDSLVYLVSKNLVDQLVKVWIVRKNDVSALIPHEALFVDVGCGVSADIARLLIHRPIVVAQFVQTIGRAKPRWSS